jgi:phosphoribosylglycinamide formyltransferase-1
VTRRLAVLISGRGSNLRAILDAISAGSLDATIAIVVSNKPDAPGLSHARAAGVESVHLAPGSYEDRDRYDRAIVELLRPLDIGLVCLAGYMRLVGPVLLEAFPNRILNIHPSLLPSFPGLHAQRQALDHGVRVSGATVHLVDGHLDAGPIVLQAAVPVLDDDSV